MGIKAKPATIPPLPRNPIGRPTKERRMLHLDGTVNWDSRATDVVTMLAAGYTDTETARQTGIHRNTVYNLRKLPDFAAELDRLTMMTSVAVKAERMRLTMRVLRKLMGDDLGTIKTKADLLDWLKFAQSETDGVKLDLSGFFASIGKTDGAMASPESTRLPELSAFDDDEDTDEWTDDDIQ